MVKEKKYPDVCLHPDNRLAKEYHHGDIYEQVVEPNLSPSLYQMVQTATVGSMPGSSPAYSYPDLEDDDDLAHEHPDYEKLNQLDIVEKEVYVNEWLSKPENYEKAKETTSSKDSTESEQGAEGEQSASNEQ